MDNARATARPITPAPITTVSTFAAADDEDAMVHGTLLVWRVWSKASIGGFAF